MSESSRCLTKGFLVGAVLIGLSFLTALWLGVLSFDGGDDDRPPIIVNYGSIQFRALQVKEDYGEWEAEGSGKYGHRHTNKGPSIYNVNLLLGVQNCVDEGKNQIADYVFKNVVGFFVDYDDSGPKKLFVRSVQAGNDRFLELELSTAPTIDDDLLTVGSATTAIKTVTLSLYPAGDKTATCAYGALPHVIFIEQKK